MRQYLLGWVSLTYFIVDSLSDLLPISVDWGATEDYDDESTSLQTDAANHYCQPGKQT